MGRPWPEENDEDAAASRGELLGPLLKDWRDVLVRHVLKWLDPTDCAMLARVAKPWRAVVVANNLPRAGERGAVRLKIDNFVGSGQMLLWAKENRSGAYTRPLLSST